MTYNIHPIFVHFPIALLLFYSLIKIVPFGRWFPRVSWKHIERALLVTGVLGAFAAAYTGSIAERLVRPEHSLVEMHSLFASISIFLYTALLVGELLFFLTPIMIPKLNLPWLTSTLLFIQKILLHPVLSRIIAAAGLIAITVTGLLGGVMVYGTTADPFAAIVLKLLGIQY